MDLSTRRLSSDSFEYRHKKFGHIRSSPITVESPLESISYYREEEEEESQSIPATPFSLISNSSSKNVITDEESTPGTDTTYEPNIDEIELPRTPTRRQRAPLPRFSRNRRSVPYEVCNAPKKQNSRRYEAATPEKIIVERIQKASTFIPDISKEALTRICQYNSNMVRNFPKKNRTVKDQERRDKNTIACRMSRRQKKLENLVVEEQYKVFIQEHLEQCKQSMHAAIYLNELIKLGGTIESSTTNEYILGPIAKKLRLNFLQSITTSNEANKRELQSDFKQETPKEDKNNSQQKRLFSIAFLLGSE